MLLHNNAVIEMNEYYCKINENIQIPICEIFNLENNWEAANSKTIYGLDYAKVSAMIDRYFEIVCVIN